MNRPSRVPTMFSTSLTCYCLRRDDQMLMLPWQPALLQQPVLCLRLDRICVNCALLFFQNRTPSLRIWRIASGNCSSQRCGSVPLCWPRTVTSRFEPELVDPPHPRMSDLFWARSTFRSHDQNLLRLLKVFQHCAWRTRSVTVALWQNKTLAFFKSSPD